MNSRKDQIMSKSKDTDVKSFTPDLKSIGIGVAIGMLVLFLITLAGGRVEEWNFGFAKVVFPTPTVVSQLVVDRSATRIESLPSKVFPFSGANDPSIRQGLGFLDIEFRSENVFAYHFSFNLPTDGTYGYAGFTFWFVDSNNINQFSSQDLTRFSSIQVTIQYESNLHQSELFIKDIAYSEGDESKHANYLILRNEAPPSGKLEVDGKRYKFTIPLSIFDKVDLKAIREVGFLADTDIPQDERSFIVHQVVFIP